MTGLVLGRPKNKLINLGKLYSTAIDLLNTSYIIEVAHRITDHYLGIYIEIAIENFLYTNLLINSV